MRGKGEGNIGRRKDGMWYGRIELPRGPNGKRRRKYVYGKSRQSVIAGLQSALRDQHEGRLHIGPRMTVEAFLGAWLEDVVKQEREPKTYSNYRQYVRDHINPYLGSRSLEALTPHDVQQWMNQVLRKGLSPSSVQRYRACLASALSLAVQWGYLHRNVASLTRAPRTPKQEMLYFNPEEAEKFLAAAREHRLGVMFSVGVALGMRQGELFGLRWEDVDLDEGTLHLTHQLQWLEGEPILKELKVKNKERTITLPRFAVEELKWHRQFQKMEQLATKYWHNDLNLVWTHGKGGPLGSRHASNAMTWICKVAGVKRIRFHDLRHTAGTLLMAKGVPIRVVMEILGHGKITTTARYQHVLPEMHQAAADAMDELFGHLGRK